MIHTCLFCYNEVKIELLRKHLKQNHSTSGREYWSLISSLNDRFEEIPASDIKESNNSQQDIGVKSELIEIECQNNKSQQEPNKLGDDGISSSAYSVNVACWLTGAKMKKKVE